ncbi:MAG: hypothetical protein NC411_10665 [Bacteroides sp.]|nr:hypothetical protein [Bacteroides sp.]
MNNSCIWCDAYGKCVALDDARCPYLDQDCQEECEDYNGGSIEEMIP